MNKLIAFNNKCYSIDEIDKILHDVGYKAINLFISLSPSTSIKRFHFFFTDFTL